MLRLKYVGSTNQEGSSTASSTALAYSSANGISFAEVLTSEDVANQSAAAGKRRRGRPRHLTVANKRPVGRPPKRPREDVEDCDDAPPKKRKPGRPRKDDGFDLPVSVEHGRFVSTSTIYTNYGLTDRI